MAAIVPFDDPTNYNRVKQRLKRLWDGGLVQILQHAQDRMNERGRDITDIGHVVRHGNVVDMKCDRCGAEMARTLATEAVPYPYALSGMRDVYLCGIVVHRCRKCAAESPVIPRIGELHRVITRDLVSKPTPLRGDEIRFLRKNAGLPASKFATLLGVTASHLSKIENGHIKSFGAAADRLARALVTEANEGETLREALLRMAENLKAGRAHRPRKRPTFKLVRNRWLSAA